MNQIQVNWQMLVPNAMLMDSKITQLVYLSEWDDQRLAVPSVESEARHGREEKESRPRRKQNRSSASKVGKLYENRGGKEKNEEN